jgi:hypothetical protein
MKRLSIINKIKVFIWYHTGKKEFVSDAKINNYIPESVLDSNMIIYIIEYLEEYNSYKLTIQEYNQGFDV